MPTEIPLVKVGMTMQEGTVEEWYAADGERVEIGAMLYRLETEKVNLDVDAEQSGVVRHLAAAGTVLRPGEVVGYIYADGETMPEVLPTPQGRTEAATPTTPAAATPNAEQAAPRPGKRIAASPVARKRAAELGIELASITGTGPRGRITKEDVETAAAAPASAPAEETAARPSAANAPRPAATALPLRGMRRTIAERMAASLRESAQLTMHMPATMDEAVKLRRDLLAEWAPEDVRVTYTDLVIAATARALAEHPAMNAMLQDGVITRFPAAHVGVAVALADGLIVPVIKDAQAKSLKTIAVESAQLAERARNGALTLAEVEGGTFTVTSLGMYGVDGFTPILNPPQAGILGVGQLRDGVRWEGETPRRARHITLSLTWDHRVLDGAPAAEFLAAVRDRLEAPYRLLV